MFTPTTQQLQTRFSNLPNHLQELIFDEKESDIIDGIGQESGFDLAKKEQLAHITLLVLTGFLSTTDVPKRLMDVLGIERVEAEKISGKLHDRVFTFVKTELADIYKPEFSDDEIKKEATVEPAISNNQQTVFFENNDQPPAFSLESLAPLELDLRQNKHPEAAEPAQKEATIPLPEPPKPEEAPVILHAESEIQPITFDLQETDLPGMELSAQPQSSRPEQATVQLGSTYVPTNTVPLPEPPKPEDEKNSLEIDKKNAVEFTPQPIKNTTQEAPSNFQSQNPEKSDNTKTEFIDLSTLTGNSAPEQEEIETSKEQKTVELPETTQEKDVLKKPESEEVATIETKEQPIATAPVVDKNNIQPKNIFSRVSAIFSGLTKLGEKPTPIEDHHIGPITTNAKIVDYTQPQTEQKEEKSNENDVMILSEENNETKKNNQGENIDNKA